MNLSREQNLEPFELKGFKIETLKIDSPSLKANPLRDPSLRLNPVLVPKQGKAKGEAKLPVVLVLSGFTGNGNKYFSVRSFEDNAPQVIDQCWQKSQAPTALYVFVDAMTFWGGSQFINGSATGNYEDYIIKDLVPAIKQSYPVKDGAAHWCVMGGSSGGYGALHLASKYPKVFGYAAAIAPDSFFQASLLPEIYQALPMLSKMGGLKAARKNLADGKLMGRRGAHTLLNAIAMGLCYSPSSSKKGDVAWPVDLKTGELKPSVWKAWLQHDPVYFLCKRTRGLKQLKRVYLDVGKYDQYQLQYGSRQIRQILAKAGVPVKYQEFEGNHFDISSRRPEVWSWLKSVWK